jgi:protoheme IX farnesyltransferase
MALQDAGGSAMAFVENTPAIAADAGGADVEDFAALLKPRVMSLVVFTALVGMVTARGDLNPVLAVIALLSIAVGAGAAGALNMWYEAGIDGLMRRTRTRPIPGGRLSRSDAFAFAVVLTCFSIAILGLAANWLAAVLLAFTIFFYVVVYTVWLKPRTAQNIVIGGAAGALPPVVGWAAMTGGVSLEPLLYFLIIFMWTPPHFWALALFTRDDYERAGIPMMPNIAGELSTRRQILIYSVLLTLVGVSPWMIGYAGPAFGAAAALLGLEFMRRAYVLGRRGDADNHRAAKKLFGFSIVYLFGLFGVRLVETVIIGSLGG